MVPAMGTSCSLFGMVRRHVTALAAIFICNLLLISAQSASNADSLNLPATKEAHRQPSPYLHHHPASPSLPSSNDDLSQLRMTPDLEEPSTSAGNSKAEAEDEALPGKRPASPDQWKSTHNGEISGEGWSKRFIQGFVGSRGKKRMEGEAAPANRFAPGSAVDHWKRMYNGENSADALSKRFSHAFVGSRGKRDVGDEAFVAKRFLPYDFDQRQRITRRWFNPAGFTASRGKRYMPGLEALLLSQMYKKLDAEKWKRQSMLGFHAARG